MPWRLLKKPRFQKDVAGISKADRERIIRAIEELVINPARADN